MKPRGTSVFIIALTFFALVFAIECKARTFQNEPDGYNGISWGTPVGGLSSMEHAGKDKNIPDISLYRRIGEDLSYGRARLASIEYGFAGGLLTSATLRVNSLLEYLLMKEEAIRRYGKGKEMDPFSERFVWEGERTTIMLISAFDMS